MKEQQQVPPTHKPSVSHDRNPAQSTSSGSVSETALRGELGSEAARKKAIEKTRNTVQGSSTRGTSKTY